MLGRRLAIAWALLLPGLAGASAGLDEPGLTTDVVCTLEDYLYRGCCGLALLDPASWVAYVLSIVQNGPPVCPA